MKLNLRSTLSVLAITVAGISNAQNIYTLAGFGPMGYTGDGGPAGVAQLNGPRGIAVTSTGVAYFCDARNNAVRKITPAGIISTVAGDGTPGYSGDGGPATAAQLSQPSGLRLDRNGNLFFCDTRNDVIRMVNSSGVISTIVGNGTGSYTGDGGPATAATLNRPSGLGIDTLGNIYIADTRNNAIRKVSTSGTISTIAGGGAPGYSGDGGPATAAQINSPNDVDATPDGTVFFADGRNNAIRKITTGGTITGIAGNGTPGYTGDGGLATAATLNGPIAISVDGGGIYIADMNNVVRRINVHDSIATVAGSGMPGYSGDGGPAVAARLNAPAGMARDGANNLYISDNGNNVIRRSGAAVTSITIATNRHDTACMGSSIRFTATVYAYAFPHYHWQVNGTAVGTDSINFTSSTLPRGARVNCVLYDSAGTHPLAMSNMIMVDSTPFAGYILGPTTVCVGSIANYRDSGSTILGGGGPPPGFWAATDTTILIAMPMRPGSFTGGALGSDVVYFAVRNNCGVDTARMSVTVVNSTLGAISGPARMCALDTVTFSDTSTGGMWRSRPNFMGSMDPATGTFIANNVAGVVYITYGAPGCVATDSIIVDSTPRVPPIAGPTTVNLLFVITLTDPAPGGVWTSSDITLATVNASTGVVYGVYVGTVTITYTISNSAGCSNYRTYAITVVNASAVHDVNISSAISVFPNPASAEAMLSWNGLSTGNATVTFTDFAGRTIMSNQLSINGATGKTKLDLSRLSTGIYLVQVSINGSKFYSKVAVQ